MTRLDTESEELLGARLRLATEAAEIGTWDFDPVSGDLVWDARCKLAFGLAADADVRYDVFLDALHPDDRTRTDAAVQQALDPSGAGAYDIEYRTVWPDGEVRWIRANRPWNVLERCIAPRSSFHRHGAGHHRCKARRASHSRRSRSRDDGEAHRGYAHIGAGPQSHRPNGD